MAPCDDQGVDVGQLLLAAEVGVGVDVLAAGGLDGLLDARLVWAAQRGCWKLFHDTPTVQPAARTRSSRRCRAARRRSPPLPLEHAAATTTSAANERRQSVDSCWSPPPMRCHFRLEMNADVRLGYHPLFALDGPDARGDRRSFAAPADRSRPSRHALASSTGRRRGRASPPDRRGAARRRARRRRAAARPRRASRGRPGRVARGAARARRSSSCSSAGADERMDPPEQAAEHDRARGLRMLTRPARPMPEPAADVVEGAQRGGRAGLGVAQERVDLGRDRRRSGGRPGAAAPPRRPRSPSSRPSRSGTATPSGLTGMWPTSPP